ncbi:MAG: hypothetical protein R3Y50_06830 [Rikenellaceae bacterium]
MNKIYSFLPLLPLLIVLFSCSNSIKWIELKELHDLTWQSDKELDFRVQKSDTFAIKGDLYLLLNRESGSELSTITLRMEITTPQNEVWCDTLSFSPTISKDWTTRSMYEVLLIENCDFNLSGVYQIKLMQLLGYDIEGATEVGLSILNN